MYTLKEQLSIHGRALDLNSLPPQELISCKWISLILFLTMSFLIVTLGYGCTSRARCAVHTLRYSGRDYWATFQYKRIVVGLMEGHRQQQEKLIQPSTPLSSIRSSVFASSTMGICLYGLFILSFTCFDKYLSSAFIGRQLFRQTACSPSLGGPVDYFCLFSWIFFGHQKGK